MTLYVKVDENNSATPYSIARLRRENPNVSFPKEIPEATLNQYSVYTATKTPRPSYNILTEVPVESFTQDIMGVWTQTWTIMPKSTEEAESKLIKNIASDRYNKESSGLVWTDSNNDQWFIDTSIESQNRISNVLVAIQKGQRVDNSVWKCAKIVNGENVLTFRPTTNAELEDIGVLTLNHVQKCFDAEANAVAKVLAGDYTVTFDQEYSLL